jgi:hypothetical protein
MPNRPDWSRTAQKKPHHAEADYAINVKASLPSPGRHERSTNSFMVQRKLAPQTSRLGPCLDALRILAGSTGPRRVILIEKHIDEYLRTDPFSLAHALERLRRAIHSEEGKKREGEDWTIAKNYVRSLLRRMA